MHQIKFYRVSSLPQEGSGQKGEIGSLYFLHDDLNNFNDLYVCIGDYEFESYSAHLYWADDPEGGSGGGSWEGGETGESIDLSNYLLKTGGRMTGNLDFTNNSAILFDGGQTAGIYPRQDALSIEVGGESIMLDSQGCAFSTPIQASGFSIPNGTSDLILLADGTTTALPTLPELNYLPLSGGTMSGDITMSGETKLIFGDTSVYNNGGLFIDGGITLSGSVECTGSITCASSINAQAFYETSDARKKDIKSDLSLDKCYDLIDKCQTVIYSLKDQTKEQVGMIAQEIEEFFPEVVATDEEGFKSLAYDRLVVICFKVLKDVIKRLEKLENV